MAQEFIKQGDKLVPLGTTSINLVETGVLGFPDRANGTVLHNQAVAISNTTGISFTAPADGYISGSIWKPTAWEAGIIGFLDDARMIDFFTPQGGTDGFTDVVVKKGQVLRLVCASPGVTLTNAQLYVVFFPAIVTLGTKTDLTTDITTAGLDYSSVEQPTGERYDGKPVYRITVLCSNMDTTSLSGATGFGIATIPGATDIVRLVRAAVRVSSSLSGSPNKWLLVDTAFTLHMSDDGMLYCDNHHPIVNMVPNTLEFTVDYIK